MGGPTHWLYSLVDAAFSLLLAAIAIYIAIDLLRSVLPWLVTAGALVVTFALWRSWARSRW